MSIDWPTWASASIALVGAVVAGVGAELVPEEKKWLRRSLILGGTLAAAIVALIATLQQAESEGQIKTLTAETRNFVTGGDSYAWVLVARDNEPGQQGQLSQLMVVRGGRPEENVPVYDVSVELVPTGRCDSLEVRRQATMRDSDPQQIYIPIVTPTKSYPLWLRPRPTCDNAYYAFLIYTRNRVLFQQMLLMKIDGAWAWANRVIDADSGATLRSEAHNSVSEETAVWPAIPDFVSRRREVFRNLNRLGATQPAAE